MRVEKIYHGVKTVLEGEELERMLERFQIYNIDEVQRRFETDDPTVAIKMTAYKVYADLHPDFEIDKDKINAHQSADSRKADLLFRVGLYLAVKFLYPTIKSGIFFDGSPAFTDEDTAWTGPGSYFAGLSKKITLEGLVRSALGEMEPGAGFSSQESLLN